MSEPNEDDVMDVLTKGISVDDKLPPQNEVIIGWRKDGKRDQVEIRNGKVYEWRYKSTDIVFCDESELTRWRGCTGFDF